MAHVGAADGLLDADVAVDEILEDTSLDDDVTTTGAEVLDITFEVGVAFSTVEALDRSLEVDERLADDALLGLTGLSGHTLTNVLRKDMGSVSTLL